MSRAIFRVAPWAVLVLGVCCGIARPTPAGTPSPRVATFRRDVTPPPGSPLFRGDPLRTVEQPLLAKGIVIEADGARYVLCAVDWCELCNGAHLAVRAAMAKAAGTSPDHVAVQCVHQHTAPLVDTDAQKLLADVGAAKLHLAAEAFDEITSRLAAAVRDSLARLEPFDRVGTGQAKVDRVASSRRCRDAAGKIQPRMSLCKDPAIRALPEGAIDPLLKTITLARGDKPLARLHYYATHPQSLYGDSRASSDFVGRARETLEGKEGVFQIYFTGCGGDVTVGKYNDGSKEARRALADRLLAGMEAAVAATEFSPVRSVQWRTYPLALEAQAGREFDRESCLAVMKNPKQAPAARVYDGAIRAAFLDRIDRPLDLSCLQIGDARIVHLPGEPLVDFQLYAQELAPGRFVAVAGYGDCGPGYLCPEKAFSEGGYEPTASNVDPEFEARLKEAIATLLNGGSERIDGFVPR
ncbi:MAG: hypothetical protein JW809_18085 [Pirellulales bacterium]|nr:hypothetical protein [Pirellulales bacterium]